MTFCSETRDESAVDMQPRVLFCVVSYTGHCLQYRILSVALEAQQCVLLCTFELRMLLSIKNTYIFM